MDLKNRNYLTISLLNYKIIEKQLLIKKLYVDQFRYDPNTYERLSLKLKS